MGYVPPPKGYHKRTGSNIYWKDNDFPPTDKPRPIRSERIADMGQWNPIPLWRVVMQTGIAYTIGGIGYMVVQFIQHIGAR